MCERRCGETEKQKVPFVRRAAVVAVCGAVGSAAVLLVLAAFAIAAVRLGESAGLIKAAPYVSMLTGGLISGFFAARKAGSSGLVNGLAAGAVCALLVSAVALAGEDGASVAPLITALIGGMSGGIAGVNLKAGKK